MAKNNHNAAAGDVTVKQIGETIIGNSKIKKSQQIDDSEQRYRRLLAAVAEDIYQVRVEDGRPVEIIHGANCEKITGYVSEDFAASNLLWTSIVPAEDRALLEQQVAHILSAQDATPIEHRIQRKDGQIRWVWHYMVPHRDADRRLIAYDGLLRDVTESKLAKDSLARLNATLEQRIADQTQEIRLFAQAIANLSEGVVITSGDLEWPGPAITFVNEAMCHITGYCENELLGQSPRILQGEGTDRKVLAKLKERLAAGESAQCEMLNYRKDGTPYDAEITVTPLVASHGHRTGYVAIHRDITNRKRTEQALRASGDQMRAILIAAFNAIITIDERGIIVTVNPAAERMFGYSTTELVGSNVSVLMPPPFRDDHDRYIARYLETGDPHIIGTPRELIGQRKDGTTFPLELAVSQVDHLGLFTGTIADVSERKELQKKVLDIATEEQRRIGQELHDGICQELTGLSLLADTLCELLGALDVQKTADDDTSSPQSARAHSLRHIADKLHQGLAKSHQHAQKLSHGIMPVQIDSQGLRAALDDLATSIQVLPHVSCCFECRGKVGVGDNTTATHMYRIAQEAVNNALKHSQATQIRLALFAYDGHICLEISDNGVGIDKKGGKSQGITGAGLQIMRYRASLIGAVFHIGRSEEGGTLVRCELRPPIGPIR